MILLRLKLVEHVDFRKADVTNYKLADKKYGLDAGYLKANEVVCFVSHKQNQLSFVWRTAYVPTKTGLDSEVCRSIRLRLSRGIWDVLMLQNYTNLVGIELEHISRFEDIMKEIRK